MTLPLLTEPEGPKVQTGPTNPGGANWHLFPASGTLKWEWSKDTIVPNSRPVSLHSHSCCHFSTPGWIDAVWNALKHKLSDRLKMDKEDGADGLATC